MASLLRSLCLFIVYTLFIPDLTVVSVDLADSSAASVHDIVAANGLDTLQENHFEIRELVPQTSEHVADDLKYQHLGSATDLISKLDTPAEDQASADDDQQILISEKIINSSLGEEALVQRNQSDDQIEITVEKFDIPAAKAQQEMARQNDLKNVADITEKAAAVSFTTERYHHTAMDLERTKAEVVSLTNQSESISALRASDATIRESSSIELRLAHENTVAENNQPRADLNILKVQLLDQLVSTSAPMECQLEQGLEQREKEREALFEKLAVNYDNLKKERDQLRQEFDLNVQQYKEAEADHSSQTKVLSELQILFQQVSFELTQSRATVEALTIANFDLSIDRDKTIISTESPSIDSAAQVNHSMKDELLSCLDDLKDSTENFEILQSKMAISKNSELLEKLAAQNCELRIGLQTRETNAKIKMMERESRNHLNRSQDPTSNGNFKIFADIMVNLSTAFDSLKISFNKYMTSFLAFLKPFPQHIRSGMNHSMDSVVQMVSSLPNFDHIQASFLIFLFSAQANIHDLYVKSGPFYSSVIIKTISAYKYSLSQINIIVSSAVAFYKDILFPAFHNVLLPRIREIQQVVVATIRAVHSQLREYCTTNIFPPIEAALSPIYSQYFKPHITTLLEMKSEYYTSYLEEYVLTYINPACTYIWEDIRRFEHSTRTALAKMDGDNILESCLTFPSDLLSFLLVNRTTLLMYLGSLKPVQRMFGMYTEKVVTIFINFISAYILYISIRFILSMVSFTPSIRKHKNKKIETIRPNITPSMKGSNGKDDFNVRSNFADSNASVVNKVGGRSPEGKRPSVLRRSRSPEKVGGYSPNSPYSGLPLE